MTVHHGGVEFYDEDKVIDNIRNLQSWSRTEKKWIDIPYHFMIDLEGKIYEGRPINYPGDTNTEYDPTNHILIEVTGNYEIQEPNTEQLNSLINLITFLVVKFKISLNNVKTHRDYSKMTVCPGKNLYKFFENGYVISSVEKNMGKNINR
ncbi:peptidoglycan recognition family protein [Melioribacteraceae bacterium 4301-Me]|uniref:peptidoglycan recognition protein family protein n=1 Tax=Pyranulibacter aquaticus TaxID=3163344 RepID=UPI003597122E